MSGWTRDDLVRFLEEDGHAGCAEELACAETLEEQRTRARLCAAHVEASPLYRDALEAGLPLLLRQFADGGSAF